MEESHGIGEDSSLYTLGVTLCPQRGGAQAAQQLRREMMAEELGLAETIAALRAELAQAEAEGEGKSVRFHVGTVTLDVHVGVRREGTGSTGVKFWVVQLGAGGTYTTESIQRVSVALEPVKADGSRVELSRRVG